MEFKFDNYIIEEINKNVPPQSKKNYDGWINLSSNEMLGPKSQELFFGFMKDYDVEKIRKYPYYYNSVEALAEFLKINPSEILLTAGSEWTYS